MLQGVERICVQKINLGKLLKFSIFTSLYNLTSSKSSYRADRAFLQKLVISQLIGIPYFTKPEAKLLCL
jgi:hypothetical protein